MKRISTIMIASLFVMGTTAVAQSDPVPGKNGNKYVPYEERTGNESIVYFTRNLSAEGLIEAYEQVSANIKGHTGVKLHTGEQNGPNIIPREWVKALFRKDLSDANIVETNTYYEGDRYTTEQHRRTLKVNGWTFCPVDILDEEDTLTLPVHGGKWFGKMSVGSHTTDYNSLVVLTHFKGHTQGGFGGSNKNIGIGCADGRIGKAWIHTTPGQDNQWDIREEEFMERMTESTKAVIDYFGKQITYVNVMRVVANKGRGDCRIKRLINSRVCAHIVGRLPGFSRHLTLLLHRCIKAVLVNGEPFFLKDFFCQVDREAIGIVQAERVLAIHYSLSFCRHLFFQIRQNCKSLIDRLIEFVFFLRQDI